MYNLNTSIAGTTQESVWDTPFGCQSTLSGIRIGLGTAGAAGQSAPFTPLVLQPGKYNLRAQIHAEQNQALSKKAKNQVTFLLQLSHHQHDHI